MKKILVPCFVAACFISLIAGGCSSSSSTTGGADASADSKAVCTEPSTTPVGSCEPSKCATGNTMHIGAFCTKGGNECAQYDLACAIDLDPRGQAFCFRLGCSKDSDCGDHACCFDHTACLPEGCDCKANEADASSDASHD